MPRSERFDDRDRSRRDYEEEEYFDRRFGRRYDYDPERGRFDRAKSFMEPGDRRREDERNEEWMRDSINRDFGRPLDYDEVTKRFRGDVQAEEERRGQQRQARGTGESERAQQRQRFEDWSYYQARPLSGQGIEPSFPSARGPYHGLGPRGYKRSDERIREDVCDRLTWAGSVDATMMEVQVQDGLVTLRGSVPDRQMKRLAEDVAYSALGVVDVQNQLRVESNREELQQGGTGRFTGTRQQPLGVGGQERQEFSYTGDVSRTVPQGQEPGFSGEVPQSMRQGMDVVDVSGAYLGTVKEIRSNDFHLDRKMARDVYIPFSAVKTCERHVTLNIEQATIDDMDWPKPDLMESDL